MVSHRASCLHVVPGQDALGLLGGRLSVELSVESLMGFLRPELDLSLSLSAGCSGLPVSLGRFSTGPCGSMWRTVLALQMGFQSFQADVTDFILLFLVQWN